MDDSASDSPGDQDSSRSRGRGRAAAAAATDGRVTRSRAKELGLELRLAPWPEFVGRNRKGKKRRVDQELEQQHKEFRMEESVGSVGDGSLVSTIDDTQPDSRNSVTNKRHHVRVSNRNKQTRRENPNAPCVKLLSAGVPWLVHVSSTALDGKEILRCSGIIIRQEKQEAWILTSHRVGFCAQEKIIYNPMPKLAVHMNKPNEGFYEGKLLYLSERYLFALLSIKGESTIEVEVPHDDSRPWYGNDVLILARDKELCLKHRHGTIMWQERNFFLSPSCKLWPGGIGGPVINHAFKILGMACNYDHDPVILSITMIRRCIEMWATTGSIARPGLSMRFRTVDFLDIAHQERLRYKHKVNNGFIVHEVTIHSPAEKCGIRHGNVITSFNGVSCYLPEFEDFLLDIGLEYLKGRRQTDHFKLEVCDIVREAKRTIILPLSFVQWH
ncbi:hypothetical protein EJB05_33349 [Eragrostis curvula]|uniref:PDZ domain-containing protein n=1 Tax=Eragrostis curvula TaxID=38414 RepID=A0A5J9U153_9POAL|nr:hypothetical protein EJB05_33349 [Eragrostis curvula]